MSPNLTPRGSLTAAALFLMPFGALHAQDRMVTSNQIEGAGTFDEALRLSATDGRSIKFASGIGPVSLRFRTAVNPAIRITGADDGLSEVRGPGFTVAGRAGDTLRITNVSFVGGVTDGSGGILDVDAAAAVIAKGVKMSGSNARGNGANEGGGAVYNAGYFYCEDCDFRQNQARGTSGSGGAIFNASGARLHLVRSTFVENGASRAGGAIEDASGSGTTVKLSQVTFDRNYTFRNPGNGAALHVTGDGNVDVFGGMATNNNAAAEGGAFWNGTGRMYLDGVRIMNNKAGGNDADQGGGGVYNEGGKVVVVGGTTFTSNRAVGAKGSGGAILNGPGGSLEAYGVTFADNVAVRAGGAIEDNSGAGLGVQLFNVTATGNRTASNPGNGGALHVTGAGDVHVDGGTFSGNYAAAEGGALWNGTGTMRIRGTQIIGNDANGPAPANGGGGGVYNNGGTLDIGGNALLADNVASRENGSGGAIFNAPGGKLKIYNSTLRDNTSNGVGGAIEDDSGPSTVTEIYYSTMSGNKTLDLPGCGGVAHFKAMARARVVGCDIINNRGTEGGGLWNGAGELYVYNCNVMDNVAYGDSPTHQGGGGLYNGEGKMEVIGTTIANNLSEGSDAYGGGIKQDTKGKTVVRFSTITNNSAAFNGGGIGSNSMLEVYSTTIARNTAGNNGGAIALAIGGFDTPVSNSIFVENEAGNEGDNFFTVTGARILSKGNNLLDVAETGEYLAAASDIILGAGQSAGLGQLADNGGRTMTLGLECGSPAIDAGNNVFGPDQTGRAGFGASRDIGAVERQEACDDGEGLQADPTVTATQLSVYPTMVRGGDLTVQLGADEFAPAAVQGPSTLQVIDFDGRIVRTVRVSGERTSVPVGGLSVGSYFVRHVSATGVRSGRFTVVE